MQKFVTYSGLLFVGLILTAGSSSAQTVISGSSTTKQTLTNGQTLTVTSSGNLSQTSGTLITVNGSSTAANQQISITNSGKITDGTASGNTGGGRTIRDQTGGSNFIVTNNAGGLIQSAANDDIAVNVNGNATTSASVVDIENHGTIQTLDAGGSGTTTPTAKGNQPINMTVTTGSNIVNNFSTGVIWATAADAVRPGQNGVVHNDGLIFSNAHQGSSSDGIDFQPALGQTNVTVINGYTTTTPSGTVAAFSGAITGYVGNQADVAGKTQSTIEGGRHGITGGQDINQSDTSTYDQPFTMLVTNNAGATIKGDDGSGINIDGVSAKEVVTVNNYGTITGNGVDGDGDGVDVDGLVNITNTGTIRSLNSFADTSEGVTVGGGTIVNSGTIEGSVTTAGAASGSVGRGITLAGIDKTEANQTVLGKVTAVETPVAIQKIYGTTSVTNSGLIKGDSDAGIAIAGVTGATNYSVTITNQASGTIEGGGSVAAIDGSIAVAGTITPAASANDETVIDYGTIKEDGTGKAINLGSGTNSVQILGGAALINADISGGTTDGSNTLTIDPNAVTSGQSFGFSHSISNFSKVDIKSGTVTLSGASTYDGTTTISGGTTYIDNTSGSGTGTGKVVVGTGSTTATLAGSGIIKTDNASNGITLAANGSLVSGDIRSGNTAGHGLTLDNSAAKATILDATIPGANLTFYLSAGSSGAGTYASPNLNSSYITVIGDTAGELSFASSGDTITLDDLSNGKLKLDNSVPYLLISATDNADYTGLVTTGDINGLTNQNGFVTNIALDSDFTLTYPGAQLYLYNGKLEVVPEPETWALMIGGLGALILFQVRRNRRQS
jgi:hypothetical protein